MLVDLSRGLFSPEWSLLYPQLIVFALALVLLVFDAFVPKEQHFRLLTGALADRLHPRGYCAVDPGWQEPGNVLVGLPC